ncbi:MAG: type II toxin-antitoxin system RelB/DinJ family antitoxin [Oscillibacter sp.]|nr:type II toxin-antitoxin system RelB/DinJ family antitoxin [Oscillibacter sp.]
MAPVSTNIKIDPELKRDAQELFDNLGLSLSAAVNMFLRQAVREQAMPFRVRIPVYNEETLKVIEDARRGVNVSKGYTSMEELLEALNADDEV